MSRLLRVELSGCWLDKYGITREQFADLSERLEAARDETALTDVALLATGDVPPEKQPLDGHFYLLPEQSLNDYQVSRAESELGKILTTAKAIQSQSDAVVVLGIGGSYMGSRAIMEACCEPFFNEWPVEQRGGRPRVYFEGNSLDNDATQALLSLLNLSLIHISEPTRPY